MEGTILSGFSDKGMQNLNSAAQQLRLLWTTVVFTSSRGKKSSYNLKLRPGPHVPKQSFFSSARDQENLHLNASAKTHGQAVVHTPDQ